MDNNRYIQKQLKRYFVDIPSNARDENIQNKLWEVLQEVIQKYNIIDRIIYIGLYGSQNYLMHNEISDIDCECFIFPSINDFIYAKSMHANTIKTKYGTCTIKDIRMALREIQKSSPNLLECFATNYYIANKSYYPYVKEMRESINLYSQLSEYRLLKALEGLYFKYKKRGLKSQKDFANTLRVATMINRIITSPNHIWSFIDILVPEDPEYLRWIKYEDFDLDFHKNIFYYTCEKVEARLDKYFNSHEMTYLPAVYDMLDSLQKRIMKDYIRGLKE